MSTTTRIIFHPPSGIWEEKQSGFFCAGLFLFFITLFGGDIRGAMMNCCVDIDGSLRSKLVGEE